MRGLSALFVAFLATSPVLAGGSEFEKYFVDKTMRVDFIHVGNSTEEIITLDRIYQQGIWAGSRTHLIDGFNNGRYYVKVFDLVSGELIFSRGFDSYFGEYKTTTAAKQGLRRAFHESALIPFPKKKILFTLEARNSKQTLHRFFFAEIDPGDVSIIRESLKGNVTVVEALKSGHPHGKVDLGVVSEGYTTSQEKKFRSDLERFVRILFHKEPFASRRADFNVYGVFAPSLESGCDEPRRGVFKNTAVGLTFNSLGLERYLLTEDNRSLRDIAANVPYDALVIMVNQTRYGGGGIYNLYATFTADCSMSAFVFVHELGHSFSGLADEYFTSSVAYNDFYKPGVEPTEPNITALVSPKALKWHELVLSKTQIPTVWEKSEYEKMDRAYQKVREKINRKIAKKVRENTPAKVVAILKARAEKLSKQHYEKVNRFLQKCVAFGKIGAFEGAGYASKGLYRPELDCIMFTFGDKRFCRVCEQTIINMIEHYIE